MADNERQRGMVYNIQRYSIHDGPGIRTTVFLKGCPLRCFWCQNPESQKSTPELFVTAERCVSCGACIPGCPTHANFYNEDGIVTVDRDKCVCCGKCSEVCPQEARSVMGKSMAVDDVLAVVRRDVNFYKTSGGGVTVSGGDPVAQPAFAVEILKRCREEGIHTTIETCAFAKWEVFERILEHTDLVYMDIKCIDPELHKRCTGVSNELILENARRTAALGKDMLIRTPVIPGFNDNDEELEKIALFVKEELKQERMELLKYNKLCQSKYVRLDRQYEGDTETPDDELESQMIEFKELVNAKF